MKKLLVLGCLLLLTACIDVDDYGEYWDKTTIDPSLTGRWAKVSEDDESKLTGEEWTFTPKNGAYSVQDYKNGKSDEDPLYPVKTLEIGKYKFVATGPESGSILRYDNDGDSIAWLVADPDKVWEFIQKKYPGEDGIYRDDPDPEVSAAENRDRPLRISHFDDDVAAMLAAIPNNEIYWDADTITKKVK